MKLDLNLLKRLLVIDHPSKSEWPMISFIINECYKIGNLEFELDEYCNILITKNTTNPEFYPCVCAHMDCVLPNKYKSLKIEQGRIFGKNVKTGKRIGLGADDVNGICCALQLLKVIPNLKVCFTTEEEIGFKGAFVAADNIDFFYNVSYLIQADRHGSSDLITFTNGIYSASEEWLQEVTPIAAKYKYSEEVGLGTDVGALAEQLQLSGVNLSCGYYKEHTDKEFIVISELQNCLNFMEEILTTIPCNKQYDIKLGYYPYNKESMVYGYYDRYYDDFYDDENHDYLSKYKDEDYPEDGYELPCDTCETYDCMNCTKQFY